MNVYLKNKQKLYFPHSFGRNKPLSTMTPLNFLSFMDIPDALPLLLLQTSYDPLQLASFLPLHGL